MKTIEINEIGKYIDTAPTCMNLMFIGDTGIGKTTVIEKYCKDRNLYLKTLILSQLDASEALGIPVKVEREFQGRVIPCLDTAVPKWVFDLAEHDNAVLFLDEFLCAPPSVMNSFLNFLTQKNVNGIDLSHVQVVAATNIGHYTFDPDNNILSRFCFFYTVNSTAKKYVNDNRISYSYTDKNIKEGVIFDTRSLKPRCYEQLSLVKDNNIYYDFYEGFTNTDYVNVYPDENINNIFKQFIEVTSGKSNEFSISDSNIVNLVAILRKKLPGVRNWNPVCDKITNMSPDTVCKIREALTPKTAKRVADKEAALKAAV